MNRDIKIWGTACGASILVILAPLWATLIAIVLQSSMPGLTELITSIDKYIAIMGVLLFTFSIGRFAKLFAKKHQEVQKKRPKHSKQRP